METVKFTDRWLQSVRFRGQRLEFADSACPGLRLRVGKRTKAFSTFTTDNGRKRRLGLGNYPDLSLADARSRIREGTEPNSVPGTLRDLFDLKIGAMRRAGMSAKNVKTAQTYLTEGKRSAIRFLGEATLAKEVTPKQVTAWLRTLHDAGTGTKHPRVHLSAAFAHGMRSDYDPSSPVGDVRFDIKANPVTPVAAPSSKPRERHLSIDELSRVWHEFGGANVAPQSTMLIRFIIAMGGVRITECLNAKWEWIQDRDGEKWLALPKTKNGRSHDLPLPDAAVRILDAWQVKGQSFYIFPNAADADRPQEITSVSQTVRRWCTRTGFAPFQPRDLRRTMKTLLIDRNPDLNRDFIDVWHNHGQASDVARKHYDRAEYHDAKRQVARAIDRITAQL